MEKRLRWKSYFSLVVAISAMQMLGCGPGGPKLVPVEGTLSLDGNPLRFKSILFVPAEGTSGNGAGGFTNGDGEFYLNAVVFGATRDFRGCPPGLYRVVVSESSIPLSEADFLSPQDEQEGGEPVPAIGPASTKLKRVIPGVYTSEDSTPLILEVPEDGGILDVELTSQAK